MNRYDIKNISSGLITHSYTALTQRAHNPAWGELDRFKDQSLCTPAEIAVALAIIDQPILGSSPPATKKVCHLPQTYVVIVTDLTAQLAQDAANAATLLTLKARIQALASQADFSVADVKEAAMKLIKWMSLKN
jgi:hypothetical protein